MLSALDGAWELIGAAPLRRSGLRAMCPILKVIWGEMKNGQGRN